jgi:hypothetical protein
MKLRTKIIIAGGLLAVFGVIAFLAPAVAQDLVSVVKTDVDGSGNMWALSITGRVDRITIGNVVVNRGCKAQSPPQLPQTLNFGETRLYGYYLCDPIELEITTDKGNATLAWGAFVQASVSVSKNDYLSPGSVWQLVFTSHADSLMIENVVVNRGNCKAEDLRGRLPQALKFGQRYIATVFCNPIEIQVDTDQGNATFTWN